VAGYDAGFLAAASIAGLGLALLPGAMVSRQSWSRHHEKGNRIQHLSDGDAPEMTGRAKLWCDSGFDRITRRQATCDIMKVEKGTTPSG
jgi:hypothetical protein